MSESTHGGPAPNSAHAGHEESDVVITPLVRFGLFLTIFSVATFVAVWGLFEYFEMREGLLKASDLPLAASERGRKPPVPQLEGMKNDGEYARKRARLDSPKKPAMSPTQADAAHRAMKEIEGTLPVRPEPRTADRLPTDSNSGRGGPKESR